MHDEIICPKCKDKYDYTDNYFECSENEPIESECPSCGATFYWMYRMTVDFFQCDKDGNIIWDD